MKNMYFRTDDGDSYVYDIYELFQYYNEFFFQGKLEKCSVRWTSRMTLCAGTCKYQGFGSSTISLSEPLLKFRSSNQLKETLLHEMIHAFLFMTNPQACKTEGGHGPAFLSIMNSINKITNLSLSVYHNFREEVDLCRTHIWRCNGKCRDRPPFYGYVKRAMNRKPQSADYWFGEHKKSCGGEFIKISEPQKKKESKKPKRPRIKKIPSQQSDRDHGSWGRGKTIEEYIKQMNQQANKKRLPSTNFKQDDK